MHYVKHAIKTQPTRNLVDSYLYVPAREDSRRVLSVLQDIPSPFVRRQGQMLIDSSLGGIPHHSQTGLTEKEEPQQLTLNRHSRESSYNCFVQLNKTRACNMNATDLQILSVLVALSI